MITWQLRSTGIWDSLHSSLTRLLLYVVPGHMYLFKELQNHYLLNMTPTFSRVRDLTEGKLRGSLFWLHTISFHFIPLVVSCCIWHRLREEFQGHPEYSLNSPPLRPWWLLEKGIPPQGLFLPPVVSDTWLPSGWAKGRWVHQSIPHGMSATELCVTHTGGRIFKGLQKDGINAPVAFSGTPTAQGSGHSLKMGPWVDWRLVWTAEPMGSRWASGRLLYAYP